MQHPRNITEKRQFHPKIYVWVHTEKAEFNYFYEFRKSLRAWFLQPEKHVVWTPQ
jgi:hypothetical protein